MSKEKMYPEYKGRTINFIVGKCPFKCIYCYVGELPFVGHLYEGEQMLSGNALGRKLGKNGRWFVCSCSDISIRLDWFKLILEHLNTEPSNEYLIQSKNPIVFREVMNLFPPKTILGTTAETNRNYDLSKAPQPTDRLIHLASIGNKFPKMVSIEPIMDFDLGKFVELIRSVRPKYVSMGANTNKNVKINEPTRENVENLIIELGSFTEVRTKDNLKRLLEGYR